MTRRRVRAPGALAVLGVLALAGAAALGGHAPEAVSGRVLTDDGRPAAGALVTGTFADGRTVTVYADDGGAFALPPWSSEVARVAARLPGVGVAPEVPADGGTLALQLGATDPVLPPGAAWLAALPDGEETRRFILDCTGCHVTDASRAELRGQRRDSAQWHTAVAQMVGMFGQGTGFPIISGWARPGPLAGWLDRGFGAARVEPVALRGPVGAPGRAVLTEYPVPVPQDLPHDLMVDPAGTVLITGMFTHQMYRLDPATGRMETTPIPEPGANPRALDVDGQGRWWVVLGGPGKVAVYDPRVDGWAFHDVGMYAHSIAVGPDGRAWVNGHFTHAPELVAAVDGESGAVETFTVPALDGGEGESTIPYGLRVAPDGTVWGTQLRGNRLIHLDPATGRVRQWTMPVSHAGPRRPDVAPDGTIWIPLYSANALARFDPATEEFRLFPFPLEGALPYVARIHQGDGTVWIGTGHGDVVAAFHPDEERFTLYPLATRGALIRHLDVDEARNEVWFAYGASPGIPGRVLRLQPGAP